MNLTRANVCWVDDDMLSFYHQKLMLLIRDNPIDTLVSMLRIVESELARRKLFA